MPIEEFEIEEAPVKEKSLCGHRVWSGKTVLAACLLVALVVSTVCVTLTYFLHPQYAPAEQVPIIVEPTVATTKPPQEPLSSTPEPTTLPPPIQQPINPPSSRPVEPRELGPVRIDCLPDRDLEGDAHTVCSDRGCRWESSSVTGMPSCYFPDDYNTYNVVEETSFAWGTRLSIERNTSIPTFFDKDVLSLAVDIEMHRSNRLHFKVYEDNHSLNRGHLSI